MLYACIKFYKRFQFSWMFWPEDSTIKISKIAMQRLIRLSLLPFQLPPGVSLGFAGLSEAFTEMTDLYPPLWSCLFYLLLFLLSSSSMLGMIEIVVTTCKEMKLFSRTWRNEVICGKSNCIARCKFYFTSACILREGEGVDIRNQQGTWYSPFVSLRQLASV